MNIKGYADAKSDIDICVIPKGGIESKELYVTRLIMPRI